MTVVLLIKYESEIKYCLNSVSQKKNLVFCTVTIILRIAINHVFLLSLWKNRIDGSGVFSSYFLPDWASDQLPCHIVSTFRNLTGAN